MKFYGFCTTNQFEKYECDGQLRAKSLETWILMGGLEKEIHHKKQEKKWTVYFQMMNSTIDIDSLAFINELLWWIYAFILISSVKYCEKFMQVWHGMEKQKNLFLQVMTYSHIVYIK